MISQLQLLETTILELKERYHITATELVSLKNKLAQDNTAGQLLKLNERLEDAGKQIIDLNKQLDDLMNEKNQLADQILALKEENSQLSTKNQELANKHTLAVQRVEVITNWLTKIDNGTI